MTGVKTATTTNFTEVFSTKAGTIYQNDRECCWYIDFAGKLVRLIYRVDIEAAILDSSKTPEIEMVFICACNHCYFLNLLQIISLKELLEGSFAMLELNQILHDRLSRVVI
jgi:hypothetical protein